MKTYTNPSEWAKALIEGEEDAWNQLYKTYTPLLIATARRWFIYCEDPEGLALSFWHTKVLPRKETFFKEVAKGRQREFKNLLLHSFNNYLTDIHRKEEAERKKRVILKEPQPDEPAMTIEDFPDPQNEAEGLFEDPEDDPLNRLALRYERLMSVIHRTLRNAKTTHYLAVLLAERRYLLKMYMMHKKHICEDDVKVVETLIFWPEDTKVSRFTDNSPTLQEVWEYVVSHYKSYSLPTSEALCRLLHIGKTTLDQWVLRGREKVKKRIGREQLYSIAPHWFRRREK